MLKTKSENVTATRLIRTGAGLIAGIIVNSNSSGTLKLWNNTSAALPTSGDPLVMDTFTFAAGSSIHMFPNPIQFTNGLFATVGGTLNCQLLLD